MIKNFIIATQILLLFQMSPALADDSEDNNNENNEQQEEMPQGTVTSMEAFTESGEQTGGSLAMAAQYAMRTGNLEKGIQLCEKALDNDPNDIDIHKTYAQALEQKIKKEEHKNQDLLNKCIREWLIVYRTEVGDEKGLSAHGIDPFGHLYADEDRSMMAKIHLVSLAGRAPKVWETDEKYMKWINRPTTAVAGKLLNKTPEKNSDQ